MYKLKPGHRGDNGRQLISADEWSRLPLSVQYDYELDGSGYTNDFDNSVSTNVFDALAAAEVETIDTYTPPDDQPAQNDFQGFSGGDAGGGGSSGDW